MITRRAHSIRELLAIGAQQRRKRELDEIRLSRALTAEEQAEDDRLTRNAYMRAWRADRADSGIRTEHRRNRHA